MMNRVLFNVPPLAVNDLSLLPLGAVKPEGWLKEQLKIAVNGLTGKLHAFWPDLRDSAWRGGSGESWERGPYYLDGLVPLAWLLDDDALKAVCMEFIEWTLNSQREDGQFGPSDNDDWWPRMVMLKALMNYFTATVDKRIPQFMYNFFRYEYQHIDDMPLRSWAVARGGENMIPIIWLYNLTGGRHKFLLKLLDKLRAQTLDWTGHFAAFPHIRSMARMIPWDTMKQGQREEVARGEELTGLTRPYFGTQYHLSHVVNVAMGLKTPGVISQFKSGSKEREAFRVGYDKLMKHHGVAYGMFTGDEHLSGNSPTQGTELCAVAELMYSIETLLGTGIDRAGLSDILEKLAFNPLPGTMSPDMMAHQYDQQANQLSCTKAQRNWYNNSDESNLFGLEPNYGCCTANMHQAWPKYAQSLWYAASDGGFAAVSYAPCTVRFHVENVPVRISVSTRYPFGSDVRIRVDVKEDVSFPIHLTIPGWADDASVTVGGETSKPAPGSDHVISRTWHSGDEITLHLPMMPRVTQWSRHSGAVELGPLLMALHPQENWRPVNSHPVAPDYQVTTLDDCAYALVKGGVMTASDTGRSAPFGLGDGPAMTVDAVHAPQWNTRGAVCAPTPMDMTCGPQDVTQITLTPYGDTCLRISQFPMADCKMTNN